jgi:transposase
MRGMATHDRKPAAARPNRQVFDERRLYAADLFEQCMHQAEVARRLGVSRETVSRWQVRWRDYGTQGLRGLGPPGRTPKLSVAQLNLVEQALLRGAKAHGFDTEL